MVWHQLKLDQLNIVHFIQALQLSAQNVQTHLKLIWNHLTSQSVRRAVKSRKMGDNFNDHWILLKLKLIQCLSHWRDYTPPNSNAGVRDRPNVSLDSTWAMLISLAGTIPLKDSLVAPSIMPKHWLCKYQTKPALHTNSQISRALPSLEGLNRCRIVHPTETKWCLSTMAYYINTLTPTLHTPR